jgi:L-lactate dehydrogenase complex protein LldG
MSARERILRRLASAEARSPLPLPDVTAFYQAHRRDEDPAARLARLRTALELAHAEVHDTDSEHWPALLGRIAQQKGLRSLLVGPELATALATELAPTAELALQIYDRAVDSWREALFNSTDAGLTRARSAIAETGSLVLWPDRNEPRLMSLVPPVHFVLLDPRTVHASLFDAITAEGWAQGLPTNALLISGPSKTADIQQTLAYGAHGPRELVVLLCHPTAREPA